MDKRCVERVEEPSKRKKRTTRGAKQKGQRAFD